MRMSFLQSSRNRLITSVWTASLLFLLFQGGRLSFLLFTGFSAIVLYLFLVSKSGISNVQITRSIPMAPGERIVAGTPVDIQLKFFIPGFIPIPYVLVTDRLRRHNGQEISYETSFVPDWRRRGEVTITTPPLKRGRYSFSETSCTVEDIFGLYQYSKNVSAPFSFTVYPPRVMVKEWQDFNSMYRGKHLHSVNSEVQRETTQFNGVREYIHGDPLSRIHWNASARTGTWKSKEYEKESLPRMMIVLDCAAEYRNSEQFETAVSTAASLLDYAQQADLPVGLITSEKDLGWMPPQRGRVQYEKLLNRLIDVEATGTSNLEEILQTRRRELDSRLFLVFITPRADASFHQMLRWCRTISLHASVIQVAPYPEPGVQEWQKDLYGIGIPSYRIGALRELPVVLGGGRA